MNIPKKRLAVVTGGSAGIGEEICRQLLADGWAVVSMARRPPPFTHEHLHSV
ncbi:MAG: short-chain dehydrogenase, partial [Proteobacteria bacterium]|nr:short-chain dehydrogenase [Pseudomonadota bacterium]